MFGGFSKRPLGFFFPRGWADTEVIYPAFSILRLNRVMPQFTKKGRARIAQKLYPPRRNIWNFERRYAPQKAQTCDALLWRKVWGRKWVVT